MSMNMTKKRDRVKQRYLCKADLKQQQDLYISQLSLGYSEVQIDQDGKLPCWETRRLWRLDNSFKQRMILARDSGSDYRLAKAEETNDLFIDKLISGESIDRTAPQLIESKLKHERWRAEKVSETYKPKQQDITINIGLDAKLEAAERRLSDKQAKSIEGSFIELDSSTSD